MRLSARSYPHPVLGNRDDVPGAAFQAALEMSTDKEYVYVAVDVACSCETLNSFLAAGHAAYVLHVECSNTLFRRAYEFQKPCHRISIGAHCCPNVSRIDSTGYRHRVPAYWA